MCKFSIVPSMQMRAPTSMKDLPEHVVPSNAIETPSRDGLSRDQQFSTGCEL